MRSGNLGDAGHGADPRADLLDIIRDPVDHKHNRADQQIRAELVKIKAAIDRIDQMVYDLDMSVSVDGQQQFIRGITTDIEAKTIEIADELDAEQDRRQDGQE